MPELEELTPAGGREDESAPLPLRWVEELVNTRVALYGTDELTSPEALATWLSERQLVPQAARVGEDDHTRVLRVREGLRALLVANNATPSPPEGAPEALQHDRAALSALDDLAALTGDLSLKVDVTSQPPQLVPVADGSIDGALGRILAAVVLAAENGTWARLKVCRNPECRYAYYDHSRNRSRAWCSMETCGNRAKARAFRRRR